MNSSGSLPRKLIYVSTISVYGEKLKTDVYNENINPEPCTPYAISKHMAEKYLFDNYKSDYWILRLAPVYSDEFLLNIDRRTKVLNRFYRVGSGQNKLSLCNLKNIFSSVEGIVQGKIKNGTYNLSDNVIYNYNDLLKTQNAQSTIHIPIFVVKIIYYFGKLIKNNFLIENSIKLISTNLYPSDKMCEYLTINYDLNDLIDVN